MSARYLAIIIISLLISACSTETGRMLGHADSVMEESPDSAMSILSRIDRHKLKDSELPYYALLYTQAQVKTDVHLDSDSLISIAYAKYGDDTRGDRGIRSNFYTGEVFFNQEKYREAMRYYLTAYEESKRLSNDYWHAKAAERISDLFFFAYNYDEAERYAQEATELFKRENRQTNHKYMLGKLSNIWLNNGDPDKAYELLDSLRNVGLKEIPIDSVFLEYIRMPMIDAIIQTGRKEETVLNELDGNSSYLSEGKMIDEAILRSQLCNILDNPYNVKAILNSVENFTHSDEDKIHILYARYENAKICDDKTLAISLVDSMLYYQNKVAEDIIQESVTGAQRDFYSEMSIRHESKSYFLKWLFFGSVIVFILLVTFIVTFFILNNKTQKAKLQSNLEAFLSLKAYSDKVSSEKSSLEQLVKKIGDQNESMLSYIQSLQNAKKKLELDHNVIVEKLFKERGTQTGEGRKRKKMSV